MKNSNKKENKKDKEISIYNIYTHLYNNKLYGNNVNSIKPKSHIKINEHLRKK